MAKAVILIMFVLGLLGAPSVSANTPSISVLVMIPMQYNTPEGDFIEMDEESLAIAFDVFNQLGPVFAQMTDGEATLALEGVQIMSPIGPESYAALPNKTTYYVHPTRVREAVDEDERDVNIVIADTDATSAALVDNFAGVAPLWSRNGVWVGANPDVALMVTLHEMAHVFEMLLRDEGFTEFPRCEEMLGAGIHCAEEYGYASDINPEWLHAFYSAITPEMWAIL